MYIIQIHIHIHILIHIHIHIHTYIYTYTYTYTLICSFLYVSIYSGGLGLLLALGLLLCKPQPLHDNHSHQVPCNMKGVLKPPQDTFFLQKKRKQIAFFLNCFSVAACVFAIDLCSSAVVALALRFLKIKTYCTQILLWIYIYMFICIQLVWGYYLAWGYCFANQNQNLCMTTRYLVK